MTRPYPDPAKWWIYKAAYPLLDGWIVSGPHVVARFATGAEAFEAFTKGVNAC